MEGLHLVCGYEKLLKAFKWGNDMTRFLFWNITLTAMYLESGSSNLEARRPF